MTVRSYRVNNGIVCPRTLANLGVDIPAQYLQFGTPIKAPSSATRTASPQEHGREQNIKVHQQ